MLDRKLALTLLVSGLGFTSLGAHAAADVFTDQESARVAAMCDADKDGMVSKAEMMKHMESAWKAADPQGKGMLDKAAMQKFLSMFYGGGN